MRRSIGLPLFSLVFSFVVWEAGGQMPGGGSGGGKLAELKNAPNKDFSIFKNYRLKPVDSFTTESRVAASPTSAHPRGVVLRKWPIAVCKACIFSKAGR